MIEFIIENYYVILVIGILLIFAIIGYIIDTLKHRNQETNNIDTYIPEEEIFIQKFETEEKDNKVEEKISADDLLADYNKEQNENNSN